MRTIILVIMAICMLDMGVPWMAGVIVVLALLNLVQVPTNKAKAGGQVVNLYQQGGNTPK